MAADETKTDKRVEERLGEALKAIFDIPRWCFDAPGDLSKEQENLFINIEVCRARPVERAISYEIQGECTVFAQSEKLPVGYFVKRLSQADPDLKLGFSFFGLEGNLRLQNNIVQRSFRFVYLYKEDFDPEIGEIEEVTFNEVTYE